MFKILSILITLTVGFTASAWIIINHMVSTSGLIDYQIFGGIVAATILAACALWASYLALWSVRNPQQAVAVLKK